MRVHAYVLIQTDVGKASIVAEEVGRSMACPPRMALPAPYEVIARADAGLSTTWVAWW